MSNVWLIHGPPGTGKTTELARQTERAVDQHGRDAVFIASLTRTAAHEISSRVELRDDQTGTLHAHCYRALEQPELAETPKALHDWNQSHPELAVSGGHDQLEDTPVDADLDGAQPGDRLHQQVMNHRARLTPLEQWTPDQADYYRAWCAWKGDRLDFTDLIEQAITRTIGAPGDPRVMLIDEAQDLSALELKLAAHWARSAETTVFSGDTDQCQPAGTLVLTQGREWVPIEQLNPSRHRLISYDRHGAALAGFRSGYEFHVASRDFHGRMVTVEAGGTATRCTPNHLWPVKWSPTVRPFVVYLMRQGNRWRVGWCKLHGPSALHFSVRCRLERADAGWILHHHDTSRAASVHESIIAAEFGLPQVMFEPRQGSGASYTRGEIDTVFEALDPHLQEERAQDCLHTYGRDSTYPFYDRSVQNRKQGKRTSLTVHASNLMAGAMELLVVDGDRATWLPIDAAISAPADERVWSIDVAPHHTYIADLIVTHNCIYSWRGAHPRALLDLPRAGERVLSQSYRVPAAVHDVASGWIRQIQDRPDIDYHPTDQAGTVTASAISLRDTADIAGLVDELAADGTVMVLATCGYMLNPLLADLKAAGTPFHNPYRAKAGHWNPLRANGRLLAFLRPDDHVWGPEARAWTWRDLQRWAEPLQASQAFARGAKAAIDEHCRPDRFNETRADTPVPLDTLLTLLGATNLQHPAIRLNVDWWASCLRANQTAAQRFPLAVLRARGGAALRETPQLIVGTAHCSPPDELIETTHGRVPIGELQPDDRLVGWHRGTNMVLGQYTPHRRQPGYAFERSERPYSGPLVVIETDRSRTRVTPNHRVVACFDEDAFCERWAVYLMRRGDWWRIGICTTAHRPYRSGGVAGRLSTELADVGWILGVYDVRRDALIAEATYQAHYGIPGLTFQTAKARSLSDADLAAIHGATASAVGPRAQALLTDMGLSTDWPLYTRNGGRGKRNMRGNFVTEAANLAPLTGRVQMLTFPAVAKKAQPSTATVTTEQYDGLVFGLEVPPHHHYISGGAIVHNSVKGGEADHVIVASDLSRSGMDGWARGGDARDHIVRTGYVALTRAR